MCMYIYIYIAILCDATSARILHKAGIGRYRPDESCDLMRADRADIGRSLVYLPKLAGEGGIDVVWSAGAGLWSLCEVER